MPKYEYEIIGRIEVAKTITVRAKSEEEADAMVEQILAEGKQGIGQIKLETPDGWDTGEGWVWEQQIR